MPKSVPTSRARFARSMPAAAGRVGLFVVGRQSLITFGLSARVRMQLIFPFAGLALRHVIEITTRLTRGK